MSFNSIVGVNNDGMPIVRAYRLSLDDHERRRWGQSFFLCPWCGGTHYHGCSDGWRASHCGHPDSVGTYELAVVDEIPAHVLDEKQHRESNEQTELRFLDSERLRALRSRLDEPDYQDLGKFIRATHRRSKRWLQARNL